jgi:hypothetical protein
VPRLSPREWLLMDICVKLGYCTFHHHPDVVERLLEWPANDPDGFTELVWRTEGGLWPYPDKAQWRGLRGFIAERLAAEKR